MNEKILVLGYDGYIGNALTQRLLRENYDVFGIDNGFKRWLVKEEMNSFSAIKNPDLEEKNKIFKKLGKFDFKKIDIAYDVDELDEIIKDLKPDTIVNLAHNPSGPFSMRSQWDANYVLMNNIVSTNNLLWSIKRSVPGCHLITIGSTGEYSHTIDVDIAEGYFNFEYNGRKSEESIFPRRPTSIYHTSKVASTYLIDYLTRTWNLRCTDIMQSVVFGTYTDETDKTKIFSDFHSDEAFGTVINRFIVQAKLGLPLTVYGEGKHQRGFLSLNDSVQALMIAIKNKPELGKARVWNQLSEWHSMNSIAEMVKNVIYSKFNESIEISHIESPRKEFTGEHYYKYETNILKGLGYTPTRTIEQEIEYSYALLDKRRIKKLKDIVEPKIIFSDVK